MTPLDRRGLRIGTSNEKHTIGRMGDFFDANMAGFRLDSVRHTGLLQKRATSSEHVDDQVGKRMFAAKSALSLICQMTLFKLVLCGTLVTP